MSDRPGKVYLVGAGIGSVAYLTLRGQQLLNNAQVLIYDSLVDSQLLDLVPENCLKLNVGKRGGFPSANQNTINQLLVTYCLQGKQIIRLKSGDPSIFGRVDSEIKVLTQANCNYELVPGISSALAAPFLAGIPLTDKKLSCCFTVLTGHKPDLLNWKALAKIDTLVILMAGRTLPQIVSQLQKNGRLSSEPTAIIRHGGSPRQEVWISTLGDIVDQVSEVSLSPAVIVIGEVVGLRNVDFSYSPLAGQTVLVTRAAGQSNQFSMLLQQQGARVIEMPALEIIPPSSWKGLDHAIEKLSSFDWLIFASANGIKFFFQRLETLGEDARALAGIKLAVVGKKTAYVLKKYGLKPDFIPPDFIADSLVDNFPESLDNKNILFPRVETGGRDLLVKKLKQQGAQVLEIATYQSGCPNKIDSKAWEVLQQEKVNIITFTSSKTVHNFHHLISQQLGRISQKKISSILAKIIIASIGPQTSKTCYELLGKTDIEAREYTLEGLTKALVAKIGNGQY
ncbi:bifunctional uroporphyrin-III C-methyltransferase/uroporphyrinogen-III synthase [cyanobacterium endosymbiont of Rhopalodia gibberula]|uniref:uroporphyrinogen-III C-methyltransferase n=1 Tax=cyanobacterium endosymbiont of Rhopalodia gibberula TaxID=1763363 RepID=UPI000DC6E9B7|nr:uroporphyrinogen-III C-methyltransferase [cyanobacterium endosymbiont of Rhopalodia gibberula]BBA79181.1 bifunctional uroporphyrin-III C-methyltransferase/uroporphyrinogen-III synthase [cyanobacterium endosymbiont of Rhopalodia gibberula]